MTLEDPFFVVKDEVFKALNRTRGLYLRWQELSDGSPVSCHEAEWTSNELKNALRSIEWDLEDLEDTINIVERNSSKFKIESKELSNRKSFINTTRQEVKDMKDRMDINWGRECDGTARQPLLADESPHATPVWNSTPKFPKYAKLPDQDSPARGDDRFSSDIQNIQQKMLDMQDEQLQVISNSMGNLKTVSRQIGSELDEQSVMLDDFNTALENADSKLDTTLKKVSKVLRMTNDRSQWMAIGILICVIFIVVILFIIM